MTTLTTEAIPSTVQRPGWAQRMRTERAARGWSQAAAVAALKAHAGDTAPGTDTLLRNWKRWEAGTVHPDEFYRPLIALTFGTVTGAFFPAERNSPFDVALSQATGMDSTEVVARLRATDVSAATLEAVRLTADRLCCEYPYMPSEQFQLQAHTWLARIVALLDNRLSLSQHREVVSLAGTVALILGCVQYDMGQRAEAESTRRAALALTTEAEDTHQMSWAYELRAWFALTQGNYRGVIEASDAGQSVAPSSRAAVQLAAQKAKGWARLGDRRQVELALEQGRTLLESQPYPENLDHHFAVDPGKFDFYAMDCYRVVGENDLAKLYAQEVARSCVDATGAVFAPMRLSEAQLTLGVCAARDGDLEGAIAHGNQAFAGERQSLPSLLMSSRELVTELTQRYPKEARTAAYVERVQTLQRTTAAGTSHETTEPGLNGLGH